MAKSCNKEISHFPHPFSGKQLENLFTIEIVPLRIVSKPNAKNFQNFKTWNWELQLFMFHDHLKY